MTKYVDDTDDLAHEPRLCKFIKLYPKINYALNIVHEAWLDVQESGYCDKPYELQDLKDFELGIRAYRDYVAYIKLYCDRNGISENSFDDEGIFLDEELLAKIFRLENTQDNYDEMTEK